MSDTTPDTTALRALAEASRRVADDLGIPTDEWCAADDLVDVGFTPEGAAYVAAADPTTVRALCDGYDEAQRLRSRSHNPNDERIEQALADAEAEVQRLRAWVWTVERAAHYERDAARQALADLIGELRGAIDPAILDPYDPDLFQCTHCEQYRDVTDGTDSVAGMACHDCASKP